MPTPSECGATCGASSAAAVAIAEERELAAERDLACETLYRCLAAALSNPDSAAWTLARDTSTFVAARLACELLREQFAGATIPLGFGESALERLDARPLFRDWPTDAATAVAEYARVFGFAGSRECSPYETEYHPNDETFYRSQQMADVAGFYRAFGLNVSPARHERTDHVTLELEFSAFLLMKKRLAARGDFDQAAVAAAVVQAARCNFLKDHLCWWAPSFTIALRRKAGGGFYEAAADLLSALLPLERHRLGVAPPLMPLEARGDDAGEAANCEGCALARS